MDNPPAPWTLERKRWIFYVVTKIRGHHYPLAIASHATVPSWRSPVWSPLAMTLTVGHVSCTFTHIAVRQEVTAEAEAAIDYYARGDAAVLGAPYISAPPSPEDDHPGATAFGYENKWGRRRQRAPPEQPFPCVAEALLKGLTRAAPAADASLPWTLLPINTALDPMDESYGAVVVDVTDFARPSYGIVRFEKEEAMDKTGPPTVMSVMDLSEYDKRWNDALESSVEWLNVLPPGLHIPNVSDAPKLERSATDALFYHRFPASHRAPSPAISSLTAQAAAALVRNAQALDAASISTVHQLSIPGFAQALLSELSGQPHSEPGSAPRHAAAARLLAVAFAGQADVSLIRMHGFTFDSIADVLLTTDLFSTVRFLRLAPNTLRGDTRKFVDVLQRMGRLEGLLLLDNPAAGLGESTNHEQLLKDIASRQEGRRTETDHPPRIPNKLFTSYARPAVLRRYWMHAHAHC